MEENRRAKDFENPFNHSQMKSNRTSTAVELRKSKRENLTQKQRNINEAPEWIKLGDHFQEDYKDSDLPEIFSNLLIQSDHSYLFVAQAVRKVLTGNEETVGRIVTSEIMAYLKFWLRRDDFTQLQYESAWICTNISASNYCQAIDQAGLLPDLVHLLSSGRPEVMVQAAWAIGNIVANTAEERNKIVEFGAIPLLVRAAYSVDSHKKHSETVLWTINNLVRKKPHLDYQKVREVFLVLFPSLYTKSVNSQIDICWSIKAYLDEGEILNELIKKENLELFKGFCKAKKSKLSSISLQIFGGVFYKSDIFSKIVLEDNFADILAECLERQNKEVKRYAVWAIANLTGEKTNLLPYLFEAHIFEKIFHLVETSSQIIVSECAWAICNASVVCTLEEMVRLVELGLIKSLVELLEKNINPGIVFEALIKVLAKGAEILTNDGKNLFVLAFDNYQGFELVKKIAVSECDEKVIAKANKVLQFFEDGDEEWREDQRLELMVEDTFKID